MKQTFSSFFLMVLVGAPSTTFSQPTTQQETIAEHPIVILISPPRSLSTAFLRMMAARGDFTSLHEYFTCCYAQKNETAILRHLVLQRT